MARWRARHSDEFERWFSSLTAAQKGAVVAAVEILEERGPTLGRPLVDRVKGSAFGRWETWYDEQIPVADRLFAEHQKALLKRTGK